ncbi:MAG: PQQ-binding-like beta-propeller repeat protein [Streptosporangiales bacterium]|nr:PQQ-binding-like beta-propeller repeat protein [Streptosporangiales bacterium]
MAHGSRVGRSRAEAPARFRGRRGWPGRGAAGGRRPRREAVARVGARRGDGRILGDFPAPKGTEDVEAVVDRGVVLSGERTVIAVDPADGEVRWRRTLDPWYSATVLDGVLYTDDNPDPDAGVMRRIQRVELRSGRVLPAFTLPAELRGHGVLRTESLEPGLLFVDNWGSEDEHTRTGAVRGRTGQVLWTSSEDDGGVQEIDRAADPPTVYLHTPSEDVLVAREATTGKVAAEDVDEEVFNGWGGVVTGATVDETDPDENGVSRLRGIEVGSGDVPWRGPPMIGFSEMASWVDGSPGLFVGLACAPGGVRDSRPDEITPGVRCTKPRLFALNW